MEEKQSVSLFLSLSLSLISLSHSLSVLQFRRKKQQPVLASYATAECPPIYSGWARRQHMPAVWQLYHTVKMQLTYELFSIDVYWSQLEKSLYEAFFKRVRERCVLSRRQNNDL